MIEDLLARLHRRRWLASTMSCVFLEAAGSCCTCGCRWRHPSTTSSCLWQPRFSMHHRSQACFRVLSSSVFGALCNVQGVCRELLTTTDVNQDRVIEYDELVVPVATEILMEILMATQLKRVSQRACRHELGRVKPALCCLIRWPSVPWCCVSVVYSPCPAGCMAASHDASARCVPLPPPHHKGAWGHVKRAN